MTHFSKSVCHFLQLTTLITSLIILPLYANNNYINFHNVQPPYQHHQQQQQQHQFIIEGPTDQQAKIGDQALLKCKIKNLRGEPQWCIDDFCLGVSKRDTGTSINNNEQENAAIRYSNKNNENENNLTLKGRPRYRVVGDKSKGEFNLLIEPVQLQDNMYFYCMATAASETIKAVKSRKIFLTVLTYPQSLSLDNPVHVSLNKPSTIQCVARQSRPPVKILISINGHLINDESKYKTEILQIPIKSQYIESQDNANSGNGDVETDHQHHNNKKRFSHIQSLSMITPEKLRESYYDTITNLTIDDVTMKMEGQTVECFAYSFMNTGNYLQIFSSNRYSVNNNRNFNSYQNNVMSTKSLIQVDYAPEVNLKIVSTHHRLLKEEDVISLVCETRATPAIQSYKWYIGSNYLSGVSDPSLNLKLRKEMHLQKITCEATNTVASVKASLKLNILFKPSFVKGTKSYMLIDKSACNKPLTLDCQVNSNPASNITWFRRQLSRSFLNKQYYYSNEKKFKIKDNSFYYSLFGGLASSSSNVGSSSSFNLDYLNDMYEDELIGSGQTYTIASFSCANILNNVRNRTKSNRSKTMNKVLKSRYSKISTQNSATRTHSITTTTTTTATTSSTSSSSSSSSTTSINRKNRLQREKAASRNLIEQAKSNEFNQKGTSSENNINYSMEDGLSSDYDEYTTSSVKTPYSVNVNENADDYYDYDEDEYDLDDINNEDENEHGVNGSSDDLTDDEKESVNGNNEYNDFGIYLCEATNKFEKTNEKENQNYGDYYKVRRYIKINPIGPPVVRAMPSSINSLSVEELTSLMMKSPINPKLGEISSSSAAALAVKMKSESSTTTTTVKAFKFSQLIEIPISIGSPVSLTCMIEPLPEYNKIVWLKSNGQIIPNSKYFSSNSFDQYETDEKYNEISSLSDNSETSIRNIQSTQQQQITAGSLRFKSNFRVKYENLTTKISISDEKLAKTFNQEESPFSLPLSSALSSSSNSAQNQNGILQVNDANGLMRSILYIKSVRKQDLGIYKCKSSNAYGSRSVMILLREKTFMDKLNLNGHFSLVLFVILTLIISVLFVLIFICMISRRMRKMFCCCCGCGYSNKRMKKDNELLSQNLQCDLHSDKTINEWLVSSKLSSDTTGNNSLVNAPVINTTSTTTTGTGTNIILNTGLIDNTSSSSSSSSTSSSVSSTTSSKTSKTSELLSNTPTPIRHNEIMMSSGNCCSSSLLNDDLLDDQNENLDNQNQQCFEASVNKINPINSSENFLNTLRREELLKLKANYHIKKNNNNNGNSYQSTQFNKYFVVGNGSNTNAKKSDTLNSASTTLNNQKLTLRPSNYSNGNFNAKISASINNHSKNNGFSKTQIVSTPLLNGTNSSNMDLYESNQNQRNMSNFFTRQKQQHYNPNQQPSKSPFMVHSNRYDIDLDDSDRDYYENNLDTSLIGLNNEDVNKLIKEKTYRLSDLFNELSPNLITNNTNNNGNNNSTQMQNDSMYQHFPSFSTTSCSNTQSSSIVNHQPPLPPSRQTLIQAVNTNGGSVVTTTCLNKFPNPFTNSNTNISLGSGTISKTTKFYNNFNRNPIDNKPPPPPPPILNSNEQCRHLNLNI